MIELLEKDNKETLVTEYFWGYNKILNELGPPKQDYIEHEIASIDDTVLNCLKQTQTIEPRKHKKGPGGESIEFLLTGPDGEDKYYIFMLGEYSDHWLLMNPN